MASKEVSDLSYVSDSSAARDRAHRRSGYWSRPLFSEKVSISPALMTNFM